MKKKLFGTDGIRGTANKFPMTPELVTRIGQALGYVLKRQPARKGKRTVLIGKDTRLSGYMIEQAMASGLNSMGVRVLLTGPLPTPGIGFVAQNMRADAGVVISASHNAYKDNGIKIFGHDGFKIPSSMEEEIEQLVLQEGDLSQFLVDPNEVGRTRRIDDADGRYIVYAKNTFPLNLGLEGLRIVLDCANGAAYKVAPAIFEELGAEVIVLGNKPNGRNINEESGALFPHRTCEEVLKYRADVGITLDGDADRVIMVDEKGRIVNGDHILAIWALHLKEKGDLKRDTVVATEMSNIGLDNKLRENGIKVVRTDVGDKYVVEEMRTHGYNIGGEQSGHLINLDHSTTGDGCIAALGVLAVMREQQKPLSELNDIFVDVPQVLVNTRVKTKTDLQSVPGYTDLIEKIKAELGDRGRIFVRFSGTEPVVRVLVEGMDRRRITAYAEEVANHLQLHLGK